MKRSAKIKKGDNVASQSRKHGPGKGSGSRLSKPIRLALLAGIFGLAGFTLLQMTGAAGFTFSQEAESGVLAGNAVKAAVVGASDGNAVTFRAGATPPPPPPGSVPVGSRVIFNGNFDNGYAGYVTMQNRDVNGSPGTYCTYSACIRDGGPGHPTAARFEVRPGDVPDFGGGERSELTTTEAIDVTEGDERWHEFSLKFETGFQPPEGINGGSHSIVMQWHDTSGSPPLHLSVDGNNNLIVGHRWDANKKLIGPVDPGNWHDFIVHVKFSKSSSVGFIEVHRDGKLVVPKSFRSTLSAGTSYLKIGLYRGEEPFPQIIWHDGMRITEP